MNTEKIIERFNEIKNLGFIRSTRPNNKDRGIGNTLEDLLGITENNLKEPDYLGFEVKSQRLLTASKVSLFSKSPDYPKNANSILKDRYGEIRDDSDIKKLYASIFCNRKTRVYEKYDMKLEVDDDNQLLRLVVEYDENVDNEIYWDLKTLEKSALKLNNLIFVAAESKRDNNILYYHYKSAFLYFNFNFSKFIEAIKEGFIQFDLRIGVYNSGKNQGKAHDHGSGFRISSGDMVKLYDYYQEV